MFVCCFKAKQCGTTQLAEDGLFELVRTKPGKKITYETPSKEKKSKKKEKTEEAGKLSLGKEQLERNYLSCIKRYVVMLKKISILLPLRFLDLTDALIGFSQEILVLLYTFL